MKVFTFSQVGQNVRFYVGGELVGVVKAGSPQMAALMLAMGGAMREGVTR